MLNNKVIEMLNNVNKDVLKEMYGQDSYYKSNVYDSQATEAFKLKLRAENITVVLEAAHGGGEGEGEEYWTVYSFTRGLEVVLIKLDGYYLSYDGCHYEKFYEVYAEEKFVTVYEHKA
jgi:hypothetical protein